MLLKIYSSYSNIWYDYEYFQSSFTLSFCLRQAAQNLFNIDKERKQNLFLDGR